VPQVGEDMEPSALPDRCGYAYSPGWTYQVSPAHDEVLAPAMELENPDDPEHPIVVPAVTIPVPATHASTPPRARVLRLNLTDADLADHEALVASLEAMLPAVREAWGCPPDALVFAAYRFEV
jgi:hypothetical protein